VCDANNTHTNKSIYDLSATTKQQKEQKENYCASVFWWRLIKIKKELILGNSYNNIFRVWQAIHTKESIKTI